MILKHLNKQVAGGLITLYSFSFALSGGVGRAEGLNSGVRPLDTADITYCVRSRTVRRSPDGFVYFDRISCAAPAASATAPEEYRVRCAQPSTGPFEYERRTADGWQPATVQKSESLGQAIAHVCNFSRRRLAPPEPLPQ